MAHEHALTVAQTCRAVATGPGRLTKACFWSFSMGVSSRFGGMTFETALGRRRREEGCTKRSWTAAPCAIWPDDSAARLDLLDSVWACPALLTLALTLTEPLPSALAECWESSRGLWAPGETPPEAALEPSDGDPTPSRARVSGMPAMLSNASAAQTTRDVVPQSQDYPGQRAFRRQPEERQLGLAAGNARQPGSLSREFGLRRPKDSSEAGW